MAITPDQATLGNNDALATGTSITLTLTNDVAAGATALFAVSYDGGAATVTGSGGGGAFTTLNAQLNGTLGLSLVAGYFASGATAGTVLTFTLSVSRTSRAVAGGPSLNGVDPALLDAVGAGTGSTASHTTGNVVANGPGEVIVGAGVSWSSLGGPNTPTSPAVEGPDFIASSADKSLATAYRIETNAGTYSVAGTWTGSNVGGATVDVGASLIPAATAGEVAYRTPLGPNRARLPGRGPRGLVERRWAPEDAAAAGGMTVALTAAIETDTAAAVGEAKTETVAAAAETDTAPAIGRVKADAITAAAETSSAQPLSRLKSRQLGTPAETDTAPTINVRPLKAAITSAVETDTAPATGRVKARAITPAAEADTAVTVARAKRKPVTLAAEADQAPALTRRKSRPLTAPGETDSAPGAARRKARAIGTALEADTSSTIANGGHNATANPAVETDTAPALGRAKARAVSAAAETDTAPAVGRAKRAPVALVGETDTAQGVLRLSARALTAPGETDSTPGPARRKARALPVALEIDATGTVKKPGAVASLGAASELDVARAITKFPLIARVEVIGASGGTEATGRSVGVDASGGSVGLELSARPGGRVEGVGGSGPAVEAL